MNSNINNTQHLGSFSSMDKLLFQLFNNNEIIREIKSTIMTEENDSKITKLSFKDQLDISCVLSMNDVQKNKYIHEVIAAQKDIEHAKINLTYDIAEKLSKKYEVSINSSYIVANIYATNYCERITKMWLSCQHPNWVIETTRYTKKVGGTEAEDEDS